MSSRHGRERIRLRSFDKFPVTGMHVRDLFFNRCGSRRTIKSFERSDIGDGIIRVWHKQGGLPFLNIKKLSR
jgi:hypothetical protein